MSNSSNRKIAAALAAFAAFALASAAGVASAQVKVGDPWVRATVPQQRATGAFMTLSSPAPVRLVQAASPAAGVVEIHEMSMENNVMKMRAIPGIDLPAGKTVELKPGGYHVMMMELKQQMKDGETVPVTLVFVGADNKQQTIKLDVPIRPLTAAGKSAAGAHDHGGHKH